MNKPTRNMTDPETRAFWEAVGRRAKAFEKRKPWWLTCLGMGCPNCEVPPPTKETP